LEDVIAQIKEIKASQMADVVIDIIGSPTATEPAVYLVKPKGRFIMPGTYGTSTTVPLVLDISIYKEITIQCVLSNDTRSVELPIEMVQTGI
jgi:threonine dehydrogenase-like Zn-dependent dehydrogenase